MKRVRENRVKPTEIVQWAKDNLIIDMGSPSFDLGPYPGGRNYLQFFDSSFRAIDPDEDLSKVRGFKIFTEDECVNLSFDFRDVVSLELSEDEIIINSRQGYILRFEM